MSTQPTLIDVKLRRCLEKERWDLDQLAGKDLADTGPAASRIQGLAGALAAGPGRSTAEARLAGLAAYLAGQIRRAGRNELLWKRVVATVAGLEDTARHLVATVTDRPDAGLWRRVHLDLVEMYVYLLIRRAGYASPLAAEDEPPAGGGKEETA